MPMTFSVASINAGTLTTALTLSLVWVCLQVATASPQATDPLPTEEVAVAKQVEILDEPRAIDPATLREPRLAAPTTVGFDKVEWNPHSTAAS